MEGRFSRDLSALDSVLGCFVEALGADHALVVARRQDRMPTVVCVREGAGGLPAVSLEPGTLLGRALAGEEATVDAEAPGRRRFARPSTAVAAPVRDAADLLGAIYAGFATPPALDPEGVRWVADSYARIAALCMSGDRAISAVFRADAELNHASSKAADAGLAIARALGPLD